MSDLEEEDGEVGPSHPIQSPKAMEAYRITHCSIPNETWLGMP
jgi:hypothetical protein